MEGAQAGGRGAESLVEEGWSAAGPSRETYGCLSEEKAEPMGGGRLLEIGGVERCGEELPASVGSRSLYLLLPLK